MGVNCSVHQLTLHGSPSEQKCVELFIVALTNFIILCLTTSLSVPDNRLLVSSEISFETKPIAAEFLRR